MKHKRLILLSALLLSSVIMLGQNFDLNEYRLSLEKEGEEIVPYKLVETKPTFNSEFHQDFLSWIYSNADSKILEGSNSGIANMTVFCVIERDGSLTNARVYQGISSDMDKVLLKVVSHSPNWTPGLIQGRPIRTCLLLRIPISETYFSRISGDKVLNVEAEPEYDLWTRILESDLSETVINPSKICSDGISSWWSDEFIEEWTERGNELMDEWYDRLSAIGYRGENYTKFDIHFSSVTKTSSRKYNIKGLTRCEGVISQFSGFIVLDSLKVFEDGKYSFLRAPYNVGKISAHYVFNVPTLGAKMFGKSTYGVLEIDDCIYYDGIMSIADGFYNNQYEGVWKDMVTNKLMKCNWGDCRIPDSCDLDIGAGVFAPAEKYINNGWQLLDGNHWEEYGEDCLWWQKYDQ